MGFNFKKLFIFLFIFVLVSQLGECEAKKKKDKKENEEASPEPEGKSEIEPGASLSAEEEKSQGEDIKEEEKLEEEKEKGEETGKGEEAESEKKEEEKSEKEEETESEKKEEVESEKKEEEAEKKEEAEEKEEEEAEKKEEESEKKEETESEKEEEAKEPEQKPEEPEVTATEESREKGVEEKAEVATNEPEPEQNAEVVKEKAPKDTFAVWNSKDKICLLAKFHVTITITYPSKNGEEKVEVEVPRSGHVKGECESPIRSPTLQISWQKFVFTMIFNKTSDDTWYVASVELTYDTNVPLFDGAVNRGKKTARSKNLKLFETPIGKSYFCPGHETILLYSGNKQTVTAKAKEVFLQPYNVEHGKFSPHHRCSQVVIGSLDEEPFVQDETVPLAVGCTLALITLSILIGISVHRAYHAAKVDYNSME